MKFEIREIQNKNMWEDFLLSCEEKTFLHSWNWGEFNKVLGNRIWRFGIYERIQGNKKPAFWADSLGIAYNTVVPARQPISIIANPEPLSSPSAEIKAVEGTGISPVGSWLTSRNRHYTPPTAVSAYHNHKSISNSELTAVALIIKVEAKRGTFLFCPHGPVLRKKDSLAENILEALVKKFKEIAKQEQASFIRLNPLFERTQENIETFKKLGFREAPIHIHPELTWVLDIRPGEEEILRNMRETTRYLIRKAAKDGVIIEKCRASDAGYKENLEVFYSLYLDLAKRQHFTPFSFDYIKNEFEIFGKDNQALLFLGKYNNEIIAAALVIFWQGIAFYHQGASSFKYPKIPASYLVQWEAIKEAKSRDFHTYNFWGIAPQNKRNHPWQGLTLFKTGFGGQKKEYIKTQDLPQSWRYFINFIIEKIRKSKRGF